MQIHKYVSVSDSLHPDHGRKVIWWSKSQVKKKIFFLYIYIHFHFWIRYTWGSSRRGLRSEREISSHKNKVWWLLHVPTKYERKQMSHMIKKPRRGWQGVCVWACWWLHQRLQRYSLVPVREAPSRTRWDCVICVVASSNSMWRRFKGFFHFTKD